jgi:hypothetical protein
MNPFRVSGIDELERFRMAVVRATNGLAQAKEAATSAAF